MIIKKLVFENIFENTNHYIPKIAATERLVVTKIIKFLFNFLILFISELASRLAAIFKLNRICFYLIVSVFQHQKSITLFILSRVLIIKNLLPSLI